MCVCVCVCVCVWCAYINNSLLYYILYKEIKNWWYYERKYMSKAIVIYTMQGSSRKSI